MVSLYLLSALVEKRKKGNEGGANVSKLKDWKIEWRS
jgi:hypothetical protein